MMGLLIVDLDGTALTRDDRITDADLEAARRLREIGVQVTIATGRLWTGTREYAEALGVVGSVAVMNGSELVDCATEEVRDGCYLDATARTHVRSAIAASGLAGFVYGSRRIHYGEGSERFMRVLEIWSPHLVRHRDVLDAPAWGDDDVLAVGAAGDEARVLALREAIDDGLPPDCETVLFPTSSGQAFVKVRHARENKGTALRRMAAERGIPLSGVVAIGDWTNDIPMLRAAGRSYAMGDSAEDVCAAATETLAATRHHGGAIAEVAARIWDVDAPSATAGR
jgi:Cof subfamily protein (haloacid dehalogenase superfamily)